MAAPDEPDITEQPAGPGSAGRTGQQDPLVGTLVAGKFEVRARVAKGGMARIYRAVQQPLGRTVALKVLSLPNGRDEADPRFQERFFLEAATCAKLKHPNTVTVYDYGQIESDGSFYMAMEYVDGKTLHDVLRQEGALDPLRTLAIALEITRSLDEAHTQHVVHRDLKPSNIMLVDTPDGEAVRVLDFGIAKVLHSESEITLDDRILGSPRFMAPEQIRQGEIGPQADVYALGVMMYQMLSGAPPFSGQRTVDTLMAHLNEDVPPLRERAPSKDVPPLVEKLVLDCLEKDARNRPQNAGELKVLLRSALAALTESTTDTGRLPTEALLRRAAERRRASQEPTLASPAPGTPTRGGLALLIGFGMLGVLLLLVGIAGVVSRSGLPPAPSGDPPLGAVSPENAPAPGGDRAEVAAAAPAAVTAGALRVTSTPAGAELWEGTRLHGITPLAIPLSAPGSAARQFELRLDGYETHTWVQQGSSTDVEIVASLARIPPKTRKPARPAPKPKPEPPPDMDILNER